MGKAEEKKLDLSGEIFECEPIVVPPDDKALRKAQRERLCLHHPLYEILIWLP